MLEQETLKLVIGGPARSESDAALDGAFQQPLKPAAEFSLAVLPEQVEVFLAGYARGEDAVYECHSSMAWWDPKKKVGVDTAETCEVYRTLRPSTNDEGCSLAGSESPSLPLWAIIGLIAFFARSRQAGIRED